MQYILVLWVVVYHGVALTTHEVADKQTCEAAGKAIMQKSSWSTTINYVCVSRVPE